MSRNKSPVSTFGTKVFDRAERLAIQSEVISGAAAGRELPEEPKIETFLSDLRDRSPHPQIANDAALLLTLPAPMLGPLGF